jgi:hypothetical protein
LSDNDPSCLESLHQLIQEHDSNSKEYSNDDCLKERDGDSDLICDNILSVIDLDWNAYTPLDINDDRSITAPTCINGNNHIETNEVSLDKSFDSDNVEPTSGRFKVLMGSALCYDDSHICLADTIKYFLDGSCEEVIIIQIGDRAGFGLMLTRLSNLGINYTIEVVSEEIYDTAQQIGQTQNSLHSAGADYTSYDKGEVRLEKKFQFNSSIIQSIIDRCAIEESKGPITSCCPQNIATVLIAEFHPVTTPIIKAPRTNLIKTNRESFVKLRITAK